MPKLYQDVATALAAGQPLVLATVVGRQGSAPRAVGAQMLVRPDLTIRGSVGGGLLEAEVLRAAREIFNSGRARLIHFDLLGQGAEASGMICGGLVDVYVERLDPAAEMADFHHRLAEAAKSGRPACLALALAQDRPSGRRFLLGPEENLSCPTGPWPEEVTALARKVLTRRAPRPLAEAGFYLEPLTAQAEAVIFGAGHVSLQIAPLAALVDFRVLVVDDRPEFADRKNFPAAEEILCRPLDADLDRLMAELEVGPASYLVIVTRGHRYDGLVLAAALGTRAGYIGMIGSRRKRDAIFEALLAKGFTAEDLKRVHSPIGLNIGAETPEEIAVCIVAELVAVRAGIGRV